MNVRPGTLFIGDNLEVLRGIDTSTIDLVYLDPPFHSDREYVAPLNSKAAGQRFDDVWHPSDLKKEWVEGVRETHPAVFAVCEAARVAVGPERWAYLIFMAVRLLEIHRVLKDTGSCWLHCDWHADGWLRALMDAVFGPKNLRNTVAWCYNGGGVPKTAFARKHDTLLFYSKGGSWTFNIQYVPYAPGVTTHSGGKPVPLDRGAHMNDWWDIKSVSTRSRVRTGWTTQKPVALLERIVLACSNEGDVVLDPFCGCATTMVAAQKLGRRWIGIDMDVEAQGITIDRMRDEAGLFDAPRALAIEVAPPVRSPDDMDGGRHACEVLELEFALARQKSEVLTGPQKTAYRRKLISDLNGRCQGLVYANGQRVPCLNTGFKLPDWAFELDHVNPRARGGLDTRANLQAGCRECNQIKAANLEPPKKRKPRPKLSVIKG